MDDAKPVVFRGSSLADLRGFPQPAKNEAGYQLHQIQHGQDADDWKPMKTIGPGANEIRIRDSSGAFRVIYVAKFMDVIYVLHCFQKKSQRTSQMDIHLAQTRYKDLLKEIKIKELNV